jgi:hypothetical protein
MDIMLHVVVFFSGLLLLFATAWIVGHYLKLDSTYKKIQQEKHRKYKKKCKE